MTGRPTPGSSNASAKSGTPQMPKSGPAASMPERAISSASPAPAGRIAIPSFHEVHQPHVPAAAPNFFKPGGALKSPPAATSTTPSFNPLSSEGTNKRPRTDADAPSWQTGPSLTGAGLQLPPFHGRPGAQPPRAIGALTTNQPPVPSSFSPTASQTHPTAPLQPTLGIPPYRGGVSNASRGVNHSGAATEPASSSQTQGAGGVGTDNRGQWNQGSKGGQGMRRGQGESPRFGGSNGGPAQGGLGSAQPSMGQGSWLAAAGRRGGAPGTGPTPSATVPPSASHEVVPPNAIVVSKRQQGNPVLKHIRNVRWVFGSIVPDYQLGQNTCALFLSLRYHLLHPDYIVHRIKELQKAFRLSIVLCHVDVEDVIKPLAQVTKMAINNDCTLVCSWSPEECARYLETFKSYESKPATNIQERVEHDYTSRLTSALTSIRGVNKTDAVTLGTTFGSLANIMRGKAQQFSACPGIGPTKVHRLVEAFNEPFRKVLQAPHTQPGSSSQPSDQPKADVLITSSQPLEQPEANTLNISRQQSSSTPAALASSSATDIAYPDGVQQQRQQQHVSPQPPASAADWPASQHRQQQELPHPPDAQTGEASTTGRALHGERGTDGVEDGNDVGESIQEGFQGVDVDDDFQGHDEDVDQDEGEGEAEDVDEENGGGGIDDDAAGMSDDDEDKDEGKDEGADAAGCASDGVFDDGEDDLMLAWPLGGSGAGAAERRPQGRVKKVAVQQMRRQLDIVQRLPFAAAIAGTHQLSQMSQPGIVGVHDESDDDLPEEF